MTVLDDMEAKVRAAFAETATEISPGAVPPLRLPRTKRRQVVRRAGNRWPVWLAPVAAAASVATVIIGSLGAAGLLTGRAVASRPSAAAHAGPGTVPLAVAPAAADGLPAYDVALAPGPLAASSTRAVVRATATGKVLATIAPPAPFHNFTWVTGAADDRTFVLAAHIPSSAPGQRPGTADSGQHAGVTRFFLLRLHPGRRAALTPLPIPEIHSSARTGSPITGIALSPGGGSLAVSSGTAGTATITVYNVATGAARTWTGPARSATIAADVLGTNPLSWEADGRVLAFEVWRGSTIEVRLLDTSGAGGSVWSAPSVLTFRDWPGGSVAGSAVATPNGRRIVAMAVAGSRQMVVNEFSAASGRLVGVLDRLHYRRGQITGWPTVLWSNPSGSTVIVSATAPDAVARRDGGLTRQLTGVVTQGRFTILPHLPGYETPVW